MHSLNELRKISFCVTSGILPVPEPPIPALFSTLRVHSNARYRGKRCLHITLSESKDELEQVAETHGWNLDGIEVFELVRRNSVSIQSSSRAWFTPPISSSAKRPS